MSPNSITSVLSPALILESIAQVTLQIQQSRDLDDLLQWAIADARTLLQTDRVLLYRLLPDQDVVVAFESVGTEWTPLLGQPIDDPCFTAIWVERYQQGQITTIADIHDGTVAPCYVQLLEQLQVQANLVVPIVSQGRLWGLLMAHHCRRPREWQPLDVQLLQHYALQLGVAVQLPALQQRQPLDHQLEPHSLDSDPSTITQPSEPPGVATQQGVTPNCPLSQRPDKEHQAAPARVIEIRELSDRQRLEAERQHVEVELQRDLLYSKALFDTSRDGIVVLNAQGYVVQTSVSFAQMLGYSVEEMLQLNTAAWDTQWTKEALVRRREASDIIPLFETRHRRRDGSVYDVEISWSRVEVEGERLDLCICRDISERKRAEAGLQSSETRYRSVITAMAEGVVLQQSDGTITAFNAAAERILGLTAAQLTGKTSVDLDYRTIQEDGSPFPGETHPAMLTLQTGQPQAQVVMGICKSNSVTTWISINAQPLFHPGEPLPYAVVTSFADITALKQAELTLQWQAGQQALLMTIAQRIRQTLDLDQILQTTVTEVRQFLQTDRVIVYQFDPDWSGNVIAEAVAAGWPSILGVRITDTYFVETQGNAYAQGRIEAIEDIYQAAFAPCHVEWLERMHVRAKLVVPILQGEHLWGLLVAQHCQAPRPWSTLERELLQQLATQIAIAIQQAELHQQVQQLNTNLELQVQSRTAQLQQALDFEALLKRITDRVRDSLDERHILQTAVEALAQGLAVAACDTGLYNAEQTTSTIAYECTRSLAAVQGQTFALAIAPHAEIYPFLLRGQTCHFCDVSPHSLRAKQRSLTTLVVPLVEDQRVLGDLWLFKPAETVFDDQEVRLVQQVANQCAIALRQSRLYQTAQSQVQELARLHQLKDDFLNTVSHELRTPMTSIKMATQMLEISLHRLGLLEDASQSIHRYFNILRTEGQREITLINDLLDLARLDAGTEPLRLSTIDLQYYLPHLAETFSERTQQQQQHLVLHVPDHLPPLTTALPDLERLLTELLHNACKYTPAGETITLSAQSAAEVLELRVSNTGVEISPTERERIFDKFYRIPNGDPWKHGGTGLGLALVQKLTARLGGQIAVDSGEGQTTFRLELRVPGVE